MKIGTIFLHLKQTDKATVESVTHGITLGLGSGVCPDGFLTFSFGTELTRVQKIADAINEALRPPEAAATPEGGTLVATSEGTLVAPMRGRSGTLADEGGADV